MFPKVSLVRFSADAGGKVATVKSTPLSSSGTSPPGVILNSPIIAAIKITTISKLLIVCFITIATPLVNIRVEKSKNSLYFFINQKGSLSFLRKISAQSAGVRVSATKPEKATLVTKVRANCFWISPTKPSIKLTGINTALKTSTIEITGEVISRIASIVASFTLIFGFSCSIRSTFSITIIASSTTIPIASTRAKRVIRFIENPST